MIINGKEGDASTTFQTLGALNNDWGKNLKVPISMVPLTAEDKALNEFTLSFGNRTGAGYYLYDNIKMEYATPVGPSSVLDFESDAVNTTYPGIAYASTDINAVVEANPAGDGQSLHVISNNWGACPKFSVTLPDGKTLADLLNVTFDFYFDNVDQTAAGQTPNSYKPFNYFFGAQGTAFSASAPTGKTGNLIAGPSDNPAQTWLSKSFVPTLETDLTQLNQFDFGLGIYIDQCNYYLDNITFVLKSGVAVTGNTVDFTFEDNTIGDTYPATSGTATVVANPAPTADNQQSLHYQLTNYDQLITLGMVEVPEGYTLADCQSISYDVYTTANQSKELLIKIGDNPLWGNGIYKKVSSGGSWGTVSVNPLTGETTDADGGKTAKAGSKGGTSVYTDGSLTSFNLALGIGDNAIDYYLDNVILTFVNQTGVVQVKPVISNAYGVTGGIVVNAINEKVSVYGIDGRLIKQTVATGFNTSIPLSQGIYIVKVGTDSPVKVVVR